MHSTFVRCVLHRLNYLRDDLNVFRESKRDSYGTPFYTQCTLGILAESANRYASENRVEEKKIENGHKMVLFVQFSIT